MEQASVPAEPPEKEVSLRSVPIRGGGRGDSTLGLWTWGFLFLRKAKRGKTETPSPLRLKIA